MLAAFRNISAPRAMQQQAYPNDTEHMRCQQDECSTHTCIPYAAMHSHPVVVLQLSACHLSPAQRLPSSMRTSNIRPATNPPQVHTPSYPLPHLQPDRRRSRKLSDAGGYEAIEERVQTQLDALRGRHHVPEHLLLELPFQPPRSWEYLTDIVVGGGMVTQYVITMLAALTLTQARVEEAWDVVSRRAGAGPVGWWYACMFCQPSCWKGAPRPPACQHYAALQTRGCNAPVRCCTAPGSSTVPVMHPTLPLACCCAEQQRSDAAGPLHPGVLPAGHPHHAAAGQRRGAHHCLPACLPSNTPTCAKTARWRC